MLPIVLFFLAIFSYYYWCLDLRCYRSVTYNKSPSLNVLHEGFITLWFIGFISSQYLIKDVVHFGGRFISTVDQGWVEEIRGQGALKLSRKLRVGLISLNTGAIPLLIMVGALVTLALFSL